MMANKLQFGAMGDYPLEALRDVYEVNVVAPLGLIQLALPVLRSRRGAVVNVTSDAAVEAYPGWGGYGSAKAALDQLTAVLAAEQPGYSVYAVDPGDMRTDMHQQAFPGEERRLVPSNRDVATYDLAPEMSAAPVTDGVVEALRPGGPGFILVNYANPDMVGHTGKLAPAVSALETIDACIGRIVTAAAGSAASVL